MKTYEIRIMAGRQCGPDIYTGSHLNDHAAVRRAMMLVKPRQWIEVWCGPRCIYAGSPRAGSPAPAPYPVNVPGRELRHS